MDCMMQIFSLTELYHTECQIWHRLTVPKMYDSLLISDLAQHDSRLIHPGVYRMYSHIYCQIRFKIMMLPKICDACQSSYTIWGEFTFCRVNSPTSLWPQHPLLGLERWGLTLIDACHNSTSTCVCIYTGASELCWSSLGHSKGDTHCVS